MPALAIENLAVSFGARHLFTDVSLSLEQGETAVLSGPSGCGKSTLLACIAGFAKPDRGRILIGDKALSTENVWSLRQTIALVPQALHLGGGTVHDWVQALLAFKSNQGLSDSGLETELNALGLDAAILAQSAADVSGGEKQRLAVAVALILKRPILLLDEPSSALDAASKERLFARLAQLADTTILMISHEQKDTITFPHRSVKLGGQNGCL